MFQFLFILMFCFFGPLCASQASFDISPAADVSVETDKTAVEDHTASKTTTQKSKHKKKTSVLENVVLGTVGAATLVAAYFAIAGGFSTKPSKKPIDYSEIEKLDQSTPQWQNTYGKTGFNQPHNNRSDANPPKPRLPSRIIGFYDETIAVAADSEHPNSCMTWKDLESALMSDSSGDLPFFEKSHWFIQWLFPAFQVGLNPWVETWTNETLQQFKASQALMKKLCEVFQCIVVRYYKLNMKKKGDTVTISINADTFAQTLASMRGEREHNQLRITRMLSTLTKLGLSNYAQAFYTCLQEIQRRDSSDPAFNKCVEIYWKQACQDS